MDRILLDASLALETLQVGSAYALCVESSGRESDDVDTVILALGVTCTIPQAWNTVACS